jgi:hypothetical protein
MTGKDWVNSEWRRYYSRTPDLTINDNPRLVNENFTGALIFCHFVRTHLIFVGEFDAVVDVGEA